MATLTALQTKVKYNIGGRSDKDAVITEYLNQAELDLALAADWEELRDIDSSQTLSAASSSITLPTTIRRVDAVRLVDASSNSYKVELVGKSYFYEVYPDVTPIITGQPMHCYVEGGSIYFDKKADVNYTVHLDIYKYPTAMSDGTDTPTVTGKDDILVAQASGYVFASLKQTDMAQFWFAIATQKMMERIEETMAKKPVGQLEPW